MMNYYNYFTEIEEHFVKRRGKHLLISPVDWNLIATWRDAGIPLQVALRGIDIAMDGFIARQHRSNSKVSSLCYCHDSVMEAYAGYLEAHVGESSAEDPKMPAGAETASGAIDEPGSEEILAFISSRIGEIKALCTKQYPESIPENLNRVVTRMEEIARNQETGNRTDVEALERDLSIIDDLLITELQMSVSSEEMIDWEKDAKKELKTYKKRLPKETYEKIRDNFMRDKVRRKFQIGELSLFRL
jgi:hypothetical protein